MSATIPDTMLLEEITKATGYDCPEDLQGVTFKEATSGPGGGMSASEINEMVTRLIADKQDKKIVFENQEMLLTEALQRVNAVANGKAQIFEASELPAKPAPNSQYWVATYNGQTLDNGRYIILVDSLGVAHLVGKSVDSPSVNDVQINGTSIVDGATKTANIRSKTTIDSTATDNDIPSAKGVWDLLSNYYTIAQANDTFVSKADFNGNNLFDTSKFNLVDEFGMPATYKTEGKVFKIFNDLYAISLNIGFNDKPQIGKRVSYHARFALNNGTNLLDLDSLKNRPITLYNTNGNVVGSMKLGKDGIDFYFTASENEYFCNGLLFRF